MKWFFYLLIAVSLLTSNVYADEELEQQKYIVEKIQKLLKEQPDHWHIRNDRLVYCEDKKYIDNVAEHSFPESFVYTDIVIGFQIMRADGESYISFEKPDVGLLTSRYDDELFDVIDRIIKIELYKELKKEVGRYVENIEQTSESPKIEEKPIVEKEDGRKRL